MRILFVDKVFLGAHRGEMLRGVEVFNLSFVKDLVEGGYHVDMVIASSWESVIRAKLGGALPGFIRTYAWMPPQEIAGFLRDMDVLIVPSRDEEVMRETFSQAMVQGMLTGLPVLVHRLPVLEKKLEEGGGEVFDSIDELTAQMIRLADSPETRREMGKAGRCTALNRYVWDTARFARRYLEASS